MTFEQWRTRFERGLVVGRPAWHAFEKYRRQHTKFRGDLSALLDRQLSGHREDSVNPLNAPRRAFFNTDPKTYVLKSIYHGTLVAAKAELKERLEEHQRKLKTLHSLKLQAESSVASLCRNGAKAERKDGYFAIDLKPLLDQTAGVARLATRAIDFIECQNVQQPDLLDACTGLFVQLNDRYGVPAREASALIYLALDAHGHRADELRYFEPDAIRNGTIRKRVASTKEKIIALANHMVARKT